MAGMGPLFLWTAILAAIGGLSVSAMPMLTEQGERMDHLTIPSSVLEWYMQQQQQQRDGRDGRDADVEQQMQPQQQDLRQQFKQWLDTQLARLPANADAEEAAAKAIMPQQPKRGNYMALCHFKICNMGRKRSPRLQPQDLP